MLIQNVYAYGYTKFRWSSNEKIAWKMATKIAERKCMGNIQNARKQILRMGRKLPQGSDVSSVESVGAAGQFTPLPHFPIP
jgi:hypothetical protein